MHITTIDRRPVAASVLGTLAMFPGQMSRDHFSSASGIVAVGSRAWVVGDDLAQIATFDRLDAPGRLAPALRSGTRKPDLEAIGHIGATAAAPHGMLLALGSGSAATRTKGVLWLKDASGTPTHRRVVDFARLYGKLAKLLNSDVNIEGMAFRSGANGPELLLFQRAQRPNDPSVVIVLDADAVTRQLHKHGEVGGDVIRSIHPVDLGSIDGLPFGFSDARVLNDGTIAFAASVEGGSASTDGPVRGSAIGLLDANFGLRALRVLSGPVRKVEGLELAAAFDARAGAHDFVLVTDPDEPTDPSEVLRVSLD